MQLFDIMCGPGPLISKKNTADQQRFREGQQGRSAAWDARLVVPKAKAPGLFSWEKAARQGVMGAWKLHGEGGWLRLSTVSSANEPGRSNGNSRW